MARSFSWELKVCCKILTEVMCLFTFAADGKFILISLRTPPNVLPLLGIEWDKAEGEEGEEEGLANETSASWTLAEYSQIDGGVAAQQQRLNLYVFRPA